MKNNIDTIAGVIINSKTKKGISGLLLEAWEQDSKHHDLVGQTITDENGRFKVVFDESYWRDHPRDTNPVVFFRVLDQERNILLNTQGSIFWTREKGENTIIIPLERNAVNQTETLFEFLNGILLNEWGRGISNAYVKLSQVTGPGKTQALAEGNTDCDGKFSLNYKQLPNKDNCGAAIFELVFRKNAKATLHEVRYELTDTQLSTTIEARAEQKIWEGSEWEWYARVITELVTDAELEHKDTIGWLHKTTGIGIPHLEAYLSAKQRTSELNIHAHYLYAFFRMGIQLEDKIGLAAHSLSELEDLLSKSVESYIISDYKKEWGAFVKIWTAIKQQSEHAKVQHTLNEPFAYETPLKGLLQVASLTAAEQNKVGAYLAQKTYSPDFWKDLNSEIGLSKTKAEKVKETFLMHDILLGNQALTKTHLAKGSKALASYSASQWTKLISGQKKFIEQFPGDSTAEKRAVYLNSIFGKLEQAHPMPFFKARLAEHPSFPNQSAVVTFLTNNPEFELGKQSIKKYIRANKQAMTGISSADRKELVKTLTLSQVQYLTALPGEKFKGVSIMQSMNLDSMTEIAHKGNSFIDEYKLAGGTEVGAHHIMDNVQMLTSHIIQIFAGRQDLNIQFCVTEDSVAQDLIADPELQELFGSLDGCACQHCRSIYSPAAYLADALHFLEKDNLLVGGQIPYALLTKDKRRPDIKELLLNCENANIPLPYIDIVNEVLLNAIDSNNEIAIDTKRSAEELAAYPVFINTTALDSTLANLKKAIFPFTLPFDYHTSVAESWWKQLGTSPIELHETVRPDKNDPVTLCQKQFGFSEVEWNLINKYDADEPESKLWGDSLPKTGVGNVKNWLEKTGLSLEEFTQVINTKFIQRDNAPQIYYFTEQADGNNKKTCNLDEAQFAWYSSVNGRRRERKNIIKSQRARIYKFIRLWKKLNWKIEEVDTLITNVFDGSIEESKLIQLYPLAKLAQKWKTQPQDLLPIWNNRETEYLSGKQLFYTNMGLSSYQVGDMKTWDILGFKKPFANPQSTWDFATQLDVFRKGGFDYFELKYLLNLEDENVPEDILKKMPALKEEDAQKLTHLFLEHRTKSSHLFFEHNIKHILTQIEALFSPESLSEDDRIQLRDILLAAPENENEGGFVVAKSKEIVKALDNLEVESNVEFPQIEMILHAELELSNYNYILSFLELQFNLPAESLFELLQLAESLIELVQLEPDIIVKEIKELHKERSFEDHKTSLAHFHKLSILFGNLADLKSSFFPVYQLIKSELQHTDTDILIVPETLETVSKCSHIFKLYPHLEEKEILAVLTPENENNDTPVHYWNGLNHFFEWNLLSEQWEGLELSNFIGTDKPLKGFLRVHQLVKLLQKIQIPASVLNFEDINGENIQALQSAIKSKLSEQEWLKQAKSIYGPVREKLRDALVAYLIHTNNNFDTEEDLYKHFLLDTQMSSCMMTSRLLQAILSVQLFVQRCLMNLESGIVTTENDDWKQWEWMKRYRVWEANRKVFAYPENWIEPELRDDKSPFFEELETELMQNEMTTELGETALRNYLQKLESVSNLEIMAMCRVYEDENAATDSYYIFGRTYGLPQQLYFRKYVLSRSWTAWEKVEVDVEGDHLIPLVHQGKLHLFWPIFKEKALKQSRTVPAAGSDIPDDLMYWEIQMAWSAFENGKWGAKKMGKEIVSELELDNLIKYRDLQIRKKKMHMLFEGNKLIIKSERQDAITKKVLSIQEILSFSKNETDAQIRNLLNAYVAGVDYSNELGLSSDEYYEFEIYILQTQRNGNFSQVVFNIFFTIWPKHATSFKSFAKLKFDGKDLTRHFLEPDEAFQVNPIFENNKISVADDRYVFFNGSYYFISSVSSSQIIAPQDQSFSSDQGRVDMQNSFYNGDLQAPFIFQDDLNSFLIFMKNNRLSFENLNFGSSVALFEYHFSKSWLQSKMNFNIPYSPNSAYHYSLNSSYVDVSQIQPHTANSLISGHPGSNYNWELFFHIPMYIAGQLTKNNRYEEARKWYHLVFNPTVNSEEETVARYWIFLPFRETYQKNAAGRPLNILEILMLLQEADNTENTDDNITNTTDEVNNQIEDWRDNPFEPHRIARVRIGAYMKNVVMKYIDNLIAWGDELFRQDTMESITEATQIYMLAWEILGGKPEKIPSSNSKDLSYGQLKEEDSLFDEFSNKLVLLEEKIQVTVIRQQQPIGIYHNGIIPINGSSKFNASKSLPTVEINSHKKWQKTETIMLESLYFCIPENEKLAGYWGTVSDRFFKLRNCMNIDGALRQLPLYEPPIDPALLVRAKAMGLSIADVLNDMNAILPHYRFQFMLQKAMEYTQEVKGLSSAFLGALQSKDAEEFALLRSRHEMTMLDTMRQIRRDNIRLARESVNSMELSKQMIENRLEYYRSKEKLDVGENEQIQQISKGLDFQEKAFSTNVLANYLYHIPNFTIGPFSTGKTTGGQHFGHAISQIAQSLNQLASIASTRGGLAATKSSYNRRWEEWKHQEQQAAIDLKRIEKELLSAEIRLALAEKEADNHELQMEQSQEQLDYMKYKFTNAQLYNWMSTELSKLYRNSFEMAYQLAKKAEKAWQHELGMNDQFVKYGHWDSLYKGLLSGEKLMNDLRRMETAYLDKNEREYELIKHISLAQLDPLALIKLRTEGACDFKIPEVLYDMDHPGHYFRRLKSVSISIPCITGPYTSVSAKLTLENSRYRKNTNVDPDYTENMTSDDRFVHNLGASQSIATSHGQNDSGVFELNFRDERYLPFEGAGAISSWLLELPTEIKQFDHASISDVILHIKYTAKEGGLILKSAANESLKNQLGEIEQGLKETGLHTAINLKRDMPDEWHLLKKNGEVSLTIEKSRLPYMVQSIDTARIGGVFFIAKMKDSSELYIIPNNGVPESFTNEVNEDHIRSSIGMGTPFQLAVNNASLTNVEELYLMVNYTFN